MSNLIRKARSLSDVSRMYFEGKLQSEIAEVIGVSQAAISKDLKTLKKAWQESALIDFDAAKQMQLARIDNLERETWNAWNRSKRDRVTETTGEADSLKHGLITTSSRKVESYVGDQRFIDTLARLIEQRSKILGLYSDTTVNIQVNWVSLAISAEKKGLI